MTPSARTRAPTCSRNDKKPKREPKRCFGSHFLSGSLFLLQPRELRAQGARAVRFIPQLKAEDADLWGDFLCAIFHIWAREDIGRITITLFDETLRIWCGEPLRERRQVAANSGCFVCAWRRLCAGDDDPLCEGYRQFFVASAPCMRVMRDLRKQQRSPGELMPLLRAI